MVDRKAKFKARFEANVMKRIENQLLEELKIRKIDGMLTSEIAKKHRITVSAAYRIMMKAYDLGFKAEDGSTLCRNSGGEDAAISHTHWFFA